MPICDSGAVCRGLAHCTTTPSTFVLNFRLTLENCLGFLNASGLNDKYNKHYSSYFISYPFFHRIKFVYKFIISHLKNFSPVLSSRFFCCHCPGITGTHTSRFCKGCRFLTCFRVDSKANICNLRLQSLSCPFHHVRTSQ